MKMKFFKTYRSVRRENKGKKKLKKVSNYLMEFKIGKSFTKIKNLADR